LEDAAASAGSLQWSREELIMNESAGLEGRVAVITGAGRGIGRAAALELARAGAAVVVAARHEAEVRETADKVQRAGGRALAVSADVSDWPSVQRLADRTREAFGPADIIVANAGVVEPAGDAWSVAPEAWAGNVAVNLTGAYFTWRVFAQAPRRNKGGVAIFVSSGAASHVIPGWSAYCAAKAGLEHFVRVAAEEADAQGLDVRLHAVRPGIVDTAMQEEVRGMSPERFRAVERFRGFHQKGWLRPPGEPAALIRWLCTPMAADLHGRVADIDDPAIRKRMAFDLGLPLFKGRGE
jgi:NAD(P)-dependent dehydrogenase (short-subunit alcohol dehydrogenase family)